jgi:hypothetical protein
MRAYEYYELLYCGTERRIALTTESNKEASQRNRVFFLVTPSYEGVSIL